MTTIIRAKWALIDGAFVEDAAVCIAGETITDAGAARDLIEKHPNADVFGGDDFIMLPGLINSHDHGRALGTVSLGVPDDILEVWLDNLGVQPTLSPRLQAQFEALQLIHSGVTAAAHSHNPASFDTMFDEVPETIQGYVDGGVRVAMHPPIVDQNRLIYDDREAFINSLPPELQALGRANTTSPSLSADDYFAGLDDLHAEFHDATTHRVHIQPSPVGGQWVSDPVIVRGAEWARAHGTRMQMHMLETQYQKRYAHRQWGKGFIAHLDDLGALGDWLTLAHMIWTEPDDPALLAERGASVAHNISSNLRLRSGVAPIAEYLQAGVNVGIGLDGHGMADDQDYLREMRLVFTLGNRTGASALPLPPLTVFEMATRNGAKATFGADVPLGELAAGKLADVVLVDWTAVRGDWCPAHYPAEAHLPEFFLRRANRQHVRHVMVHGEWMLRDGEHTQLDEAAVHAAVREELARQPAPTLSELEPHVREFYAGWEGE